MGDALHSWTLNGDFTALKPTGVPRYAREVTRAMDKLLGEKHPLTQGLDLQLVAPARLTDYSLDHIDVKIVPEFNRPRLPQVWVQLQLPRHVKGGLVSFCNLAPVSIAHHIVCIHDLHTRLMPDSYGRGFRLAHRIILPALGLRAHHITTVSSLSRDHLVEYGIAPADKITITYNGADHALNWRAECGQLEPGKRPYVLFLGQDHMHKNMQLVWNLAPALDEMGLDIHVAGSVGDEAVAALCVKPPENLRRLGRISDDDLGKAMDEALCFLLPSRIEGFGLPAVEAMTRGCPVVAADAPCLPEVCGEAALYAGPDDQEGWVGAIRQLRDDAVLRDKMIAKGHEQARKYTWRNIAKTYLRLMAQCDEEKARRADV